MYTGDTIQIKEHIVSTAVITTASGGIFTIEDAFMITPDTIIGTVGGQPYRYDAQDGDVGRFIS